MFPLSTVLFPMVGMPLHIFEPRYKKLLKDLSVSPPYFGVILITRGSEVGGGDERAAIGTKARITEKVQLSDGTWLVLVIGEEKIKVRTWLPDDPYPVALVEEVADLKSQELVGRDLEDLEKKLRYALLLQGELHLDEVVSPNIVLSTRPEEALWQMCAVAPLTTSDHQMLLMQEDFITRKLLLEKYLSEAIASFEVELTI